MNNQISMRHISDLTWQAIQQHKQACAWLVAGHAALMALSVILQFYIPEHQILWQALFTVYSVIYLAIIHNNSLDIAYGKKLSMFHLSSYIFMAALLSSSNWRFVIHSFVTPSIHMTASHSPAFSLLAEMLLYTLQISVVFKLMFVEMIILHEHALPWQAIQKSWRLTKASLIFDAIKIIFNRALAWVLALFLIGASLMLLIYAMTHSHTVLAIADNPFVSLPLQFGMAFYGFYTMTMFALLFKHVDEQAKH